MCFIVIGRKSAKNMHKYKANLFISLCIVMNKHCDTKWTSARSFSCLSTYPDTFYPIALFFIVAELHEQLYKLLFPGPF